MIVRLGLSLKLLTFRMLTVMFHTFYLTATYKHEGPYAKTHDTFH